MYIIIYIICVYMYMYYILYIQNKALSYSVILQYRFFLMVDTLNLVMKRPTEVERVSSLDSIQIIPNFHPRYLLFLWSVLLLEV